MIDPHSPEGNTDYTTGAPPNDGPGPMPTRAGTSPAEQIKNPMEYIDTEDPEVIARYKRINVAANDLYLQILQDAPQSAERTLSIRKLQEARMWANAAIAFDGRTYRL